ncbi:patatin-like phospholipase family protein [Patescibacteria group bacterium]|nr:patatin-like phospholipase family protein [Patescibacteria group bacterium]
MDKDKKQKFILYLGGGAMAGVFGAGIVTALEKADVYKRIKAVYAASAGVLNAAYFLTKNTKSGSTIYWEDLTAGRFIRPYNVWRSFARHQWGRHLGSADRSHLANVVDIDYLWRVLEGKRKYLDMAALRHSPVPFYTQLLNTDTCETGYVRVDHLGSKRAVSETLKASVSVIPYYSHTQNIHGKNYADGYIVTPINLKYLLKKYPKDKIVVAMNVPLTRRWVYHVQSWLEGVFAQPMCKGPILACLSKRESVIRQEFALALKTKRVLLINTPDDKQAFLLSTNQKHLKKYYQLGKKVAQKILRFIK